MSKKFARGVEGPLRVACVRPSELTEQQLALWRGFQADDPVLDSPFLYPEFVQAVSEVRRGVMVAVGEVAGQAVCFLPFTRRGRVGQPVSGALDDCQAVIGAPGRHWNPKSLIRGAGLAAFDFTFLRATQPSFAAFHHAVRPSHVIDLGGGYAAYMRERAAAGHKLHQRIAFKARRLAKHGPLRFTFHDADPQALRTALGWKSSQYRANGLPDIFARAWTVQLLERLQAARTESFAGVLSTLSVGGRVVAAHMGMRSAGTLHWWFPSYDVAFADGSPGLVLLDELCKACGAEGIGRIELGEGDEHYKTRFANAAIPMAEGCVGVASLPYLVRRLRYGTENLAARLPIGRFRDYPRRLFRRLDRPNRFSP